MKINVLSKAPVPSQDMTSCGLAGFVDLASIGAAGVANREQISHGYAGALPPETCGHNQHSDLGGSEDDE
jgi:hypothetical protein